MSERVNKKESKYALYSDEYVTANDLTENFPSFIDFIPSPEIMNKLQRRMAMINDPVADLW